MFRKSDKASPPRERPAPSARAMLGEGAISIIGPGMQITGDLVTDGTVRIEGRVDGTVRAGKAVVLGKEGEVVGNIVTQDAVIGGRISGSVIAESRLELQSTSVIEGEIRARAEHLQLEEGARFNGNIKMIDPDDVQSDGAGHSTPPAIASRSGRGATRGRSQKVEQTASQPVEQPEVLAVEAAGGEVVAEMPEAAEGVDADVAAAASEPSEEQRRAAGE